MDSYNYSALQTAYKCNKLFKYLYVDRLKPPGPQSADLVFGSAVHFALEGLIGDGADPEMLFKAYFDSEINRIKFGRFGAQDLKDMGLRLLDRFKRLHLKKIKAYQQELRLYGNLDGIKLEGTPDVLGDYEGIPSVIDFKTAGYRYPKEKVLISEQMYLYAYLATQNGYKPSQIVYIVFIKGKDPSIQTLVHKMTDKDLQRALHNIVLMSTQLDQIQEKREYTYNSNSCVQGEVKCAFFDQCWNNTTSANSK